jgi:hypothetical protein
MRLPLEHVAGSLHCTPQFTVVVPVNAASQALVVVLVFTARSTKLLDAVPAVCAGTVVAPPLALAAMTKPAVLNVVLQLLAALQLAPSGQQRRAEVASELSPDSVTVAVLPLAAAPCASVVVALPLASKVTVPEPSVPAVVASVAVWPLAFVTGLVQGLELSAQAVTFTVEAWQARLALGTDSS